MGRTIFALLLICTSAMAQDNIFTNTAGGNDSWNDASNWSAGNVPTGSQHAVLDVGIQARVDDAAPSFTGGLTLSNNASILVGYGTDVAEELNVLDSSVTMLDGSRVIFRRNSCTITSAFEIVGNVQIDGTSSTVGHNATRNFNAPISGTGSVTFWSVNNNTFNLNTSNSISGAISVTNGNCSLAANTNGALGTADVYVENAASLVIAASLTDTIGDGAELHLNGVKDGGEGGKLVLNSSEAVDKFFIDGIQQVSGTYNSGSGLTDSGGGALISGSGDLTVITDPPAVAPVLQSIDDNVYGGPIWEDYGTSITYTITFDIDIDHNTVQTNDFENGGDATITFGAVAEESPGVFTLEVTPTSAGTLILQIQAGATINSSLSVPLDTTSALPDATTITIGAGNTPDSTITGTASGPGGSDDNWNNSANWDNGIPFGPQNAIVGTNVTAQVKTTPRSYDGSLTLLTNAYLNFSDSPGKGALPSSPEVLTMQEGSRIRTTGGGFGKGNLTLGPVVLEGDVIFDGSASDNFSFKFAGPISGEGGLTLKGRNGTCYTAFQTTNTFSGGILGTTGSMYIKAESDRALGTGEVNITNSCSLWIGSGLTDAIDDSATLNVSSNAHSSSPFSGQYKIVLDSDETIGLFRIDGLPQQDGTWGAVGNGSASYTTNIISGTGVLNVRWSEIPAAGSVIIVR